MRYDVTLKTLFHPLPVRLLQLLTGQPAVEVLKLEYPTVQRRLPDLVLRLADGRLHHMEIQSYPEAALPWRMLEYYGLICQDYDRPLIQQVLYVGRGPNTLAGGLNRDRLTFSYDVIDIRTIDGQALLASPDLEDNILALLCRLENTEQAVRTVLGRLVELDPKARRDALEKVLILAGLRDLKPIIVREVEHMPITIGLRDNPFFQEFYQEGHQEGHQEGLLEGECLVLKKQLEHRFGPLPDDVVTRLQTAEPETLERWALALLSARTLEDVFRS